MKINIIFLDYHRHEFTQQVKERNFKNAGHEFEYVIIDKKGISAALNTGIQMSRHFDGIVTMANDILMPDNWLKAMVVAASLIPNTGTVGIHCVEGLGEPEEINGVRIHRSYTAFGNVLIPMKAINRIGFFNPDYDPYGMQDADYAYRLNCCGFINYYLEGLKSEHIGHDVGQPSDYRRMKDEGLNKAGKIWEESTKRYSETNDYTIFNKEWPE